MRISVDQEGQGQMSRVDRKATRTGPITYQGREAYKVFRSACPRNCYDTCGMLSYVQDSVLQLHREDAGFHVHGRRTVRQRLYVPAHALQSRPDQSTP